MKRIQVSLDRLQNGLPSLPLPRSISYDLCRPVILFGQVLGLLSWDKYRPSQQQTIRNFRKRFLSYSYKLITAAVLTFSCAGYILSAFHEEHKSEVSSLTAAVAIPVNIAAQYFIFLFCLLEEKRFNHLLKLLKISDKLLKVRMQIRRFYIKNIFLPSFILLGFVSWTVKLLLYMPYCLELLAIVVNICFIYGINIFVIIFFIATTTLCTECFEALNEALNKLVHSKKPILYIHLEEVRLCYEKLYRLATSVNRAFSWLITVELAYISISLTLNCYFILDEGLTATTLPIFLDTILCAYSLCRVAVAADALTNKAKLGLEVLHNVDLKYVSSQGGFRIITMLCNKLSQSPVEICAVGNLFRVDASIIKTVTGTIVTYLIILLQLKAPYHVDKGQCIGTNPNHSDSYT